MTVPSLTFASLAFAAIAAGCAAARARGPRPPAAGGVTVTRATFAGWEALVLRNGAAEVTVVPAIGRIMQIALCEGGRVRGPLWSHPGIGPTLPPDENGWINLGGDKAWPAPQSRWEAIAGQGWPPPRTFDAGPFTAEVRGDAVELVSAVDPAYGLRVRRTLALDRAAPILTVDTVYEKVAGAPVRAGVWTITQLAAPERVALRLPARSAFPGGFAQRLPAPPQALAIEGRLLSLARDPAAKTMIVSDGDALLWVGEGPDLLIETIARAHDPAAQWPDGAHAQIYTSPDEALPYVELELLSPLADLAIGAHARLQVRYTLIARTESDPIAEARRVLGL
ncbi:MAG TPA: hypothetical protein VI456_10740 [Polyangia bacterium]